MKFGKTVLVEIIAIFQNGIANGVDVSQLLRDVDVVERDGALEISSEYKRREFDIPSTGDWEEN